MPLQRHPSIGGHGLESALGYTLLQVGAAINPLCRGPYYQGIPGVSTPYQYYWPLPPEGGFPPYRDTGMQLGPGYLPASIYTVRGTMALQVHW
jgi:hypothetical protein